MPAYGSQNGYPNIVGQPQIPVQYPYGNNNGNVNNNLLQNTPYDNYIGRTNIQNNLYLKCRPVSSKQEARAFQIDLDGSLWVFTDVGNGKIYTKQINNDGTATFKTYVFNKDEDPYSTTQYVTKEEFTKVIQSLMASLQPQQKAVNVENNNQNNNGVIADF